MKRLVLVVAGLMAAGGIVASTAWSAPSALWTTPLSSSGSFVYGSPSGGFLLDRWDGTGLEPVVGTMSDAQVPPGGDDAGVAPVFDSAGDVYRWEVSVTGSTEQFALEEDSASGQMVWETPVAGEVAQAHDLTLGDNQDLFVSYFSNVDGWHLLRLSASTGQVLWNDAVSGGVPVSTTGGVVLVSAGAVQPVSAAGYIGSSTAYAAGMAPVLYSVAHNDQGDVLALNLPQGVNGSCGNTTGPATVTELDPSGTQLWTREIPMSGCIHPAVASLPGQSWALSNQAEGEILGIGGVNGSTLWAAGTHPQDSGPFILGVDANDDIYAVQGLATNCVSQPPGSINCQGQSILKIEGSTGHVSPLLQLVDTSSPNTMTFGLQNVPPGRDTDTTASIAPGRLFAVEEDLTGSPGDYTNNLWSFSAYPLPAGAPYPTPPSNEVSASSMQPGNLQGSDDGGATLGVGSVLSGSQVSNRPCAQAYGSVGKRLLARLKCEAIIDILMVQCGFEVATLFAPVLKSLHIIETAKTAVVLAKIPKRFRPVAKFLYDVSHARFSKRAPRGFRNFAELWQTLRKVKKASEVIKMLPSIAAAVSKADYTKIATDLVNITGLQSCVDAILDADEESGSTT